jgi:hypothetical protein
MKLSIVAKMTLTIFLIFLGKLCQRSPICDIFGDASLNHFDNCAIAIKTTKYFTTEKSEEILKEIQIYTIIGYHINICAILGYVSTPEITWLLLEKAARSLGDELKAIRLTINNKTKQLKQDQTKDLYSIVLQILNAMIRITELYLSTSTFPIPTENSFLQFNNQYRTRYYKQFFKIINLHL